MAKGQSDDLGKSQFQVLREMPQLSDGEGGREIGNLMQQLFGPGKRGAHPQTGWFRAIRQQVKPILPIRFEMDGRAIGGILCHERGKRTQCPAFNGHAGGSGRVDLSDPARDQQAGIGIRHEVMIAYNHHKNSCSGPDLNRA